MNIKSNLKAGQFTGTTSVQFNGADPNDVTDTGDGIVSTIGSGQEAPPSSNDSNGLVTYSGGNRLP